MTNDCDTRWSRKPARRRFASKLKRGSEVELSVTETQKVTDVVIDSPTKSYARLEPWLWLANLALRREDGRLLLPEIARHDDEKLDSLLGRVEVERYLREKGTLAEVFRITDVTNFQLSPQEKSEWLCDLTYGLAYLLESCAKGEDARINTAGGLATVDARGRRVTTAISDPYRIFLSDLDGVQSERIRRCPIYGSFFYAARLTKKACSEKCNQTRRVREWRRNQSLYEQNRKFRLAGVQPEG